IVTKYSRPNSATIATKKMYPLPEDFDVLAAIIAFPITGHPSVDMPRSVIRRGDCRLGARRRGALLPPANCRSVAAPPSSAPSGYGLIRPIVTSSRQTLPARPPWPAVETTLPQP